MRRGSSTAKARRVVSVIRVKPRMQLALLSDRRDAFVEADRAKSRSHSPVCGAPAAQSCPQQQLRVSPCVRGKNPGQAERGEHPRRVPMT